MVPACLQHVRPANIHRQGVFDSADGYVGGAYFLRERSGNLFRFAQQDNGLWDATPLESDLTNQGCAAAPHIVRVGTLGLFLTCAQPGATAYLRVVDLYTSCGDGVADPGEACDDGNNDNGDGCSSTCTL